MENKKQWKFELNEQYRKIAVPVLMQGLLMGVFDIFNTLIVSGINQKALIMMGIITQINFIFYLFSYGAGNGISMFVTQYIGKKDWKGLNKTLALSKIIYLIIIAIYVLFCIFGSKSVISLFTNDQDIIESTRKILFIISIGTIPRLITSFLIDSFRALDYAKILLYVNVITSAMNVIIAPVLCYGLFGAPNLGLYGSVVAFIISNVFAFVSYIWLIRKKDNPMELGLSAIKYLDKEYVMKVVKKMIPLLIMEVTWSLGIAGYTIILSKNGPSYIAASSLTGSVITFFMTFYASMNAATSTIIGRTLGNNELLKAKFFTKQLLKYSVLIGLSANLVLIIFAEPLLNLFNFSGKISHSTLVISYYVLIGRSARIGIGSIAVTMINGVLKAGGDTKFIPLIELSAIFVFGLGFSYLAYTLHWGAFFIAFGMSVEQIFRMIFGYIRYKQEKWVNNLTH